jgi:(p)ppGpp synthase/HD superfamily hydrolase
MSNIGITTQSASFNRKRSEFSFIDLIEQVREELPGASRSVQFARFEELLEEKPQYQYGVDWYAFTNNINGRKRIPRAARQEQKAEREEAQRKTVEKIKGQILLLALVMPNGKPMRDCTGAEMAKFGDGYKRIAARVSRSKTVGAVLSEDEVRMLIGLRTSAASDSKRGK